MKIEVKYFAALAEHAGKSHELMDIEPMSIRQLYNKLKEQYKFSYSFDDIKVAINTKYVEEDCEIKENDLLVFITPVAGG